MDVTLEIVDKKSDASFSIINYENAYFTAPLHIHPEYELILIEEGAGTSFVGDRKIPLQPGDLMLIGPNLPHLWLSENAYYEENSNLKSRSIFSQFSDNIFPEKYYDMVELKDIYSLLKKSKRGIYFVGDKVGKNIDLFRELVGKEGFAKWSGFYSLLYNLAYTEFFYLASEEYVEKLDSLKDIIVSKVHYYVNNNYRKTVALNDIAEFVGMNSSALCRYYKKRTGHTIFEYLLDLRISYAVKLLVNKNYNVSQIAYDCGYNSLSNFNLHFKRVTGYTPSEYARKVLKIDRN